MRFQIRKGETSGLGGSEEPAPVRRARAKQHEHVVSSQGQPPGALTVTPPSLMQPTNSKMQGTDHSNGRRVPKASRHNLKGENIQFQQWLCAGNRNIDSSKIPPQKDPWHSD